MNSKLVFLKLGGSLITNKNEAETAFVKQIENAARGISESLKAQPEMQILIGHGSGSFGHFAAKRYGTHEGIRNQKDWKGFSEVWHSARKLHQIVLRVLADAKLPVIGFAPSASVLSNKGKIEIWDIRPIQAALDAKLIPIVYGDVAFDISNGGGILSTEELFLFLNKELHPKRILLAANEAVYSDFPKNEKVLKEIGPFNYDEHKSRLSGGEGSDITGGMLSKVQAAMEMANSMAEDHGASDIRIFSGKKEGTIKEALLGKAVGTIVSARQ